MAGRCADRVCLLRMKGLELIRQAVDGELREKPMPELLLRLLWEFYWKLP
jgi:hypothetical protein